MFIFLFSFIGLICEEMVLFAAIVVILFCFQYFNWILLGILGVIATVILISLIAKLVSYSKSSIRNRRELKKEAGKVYEYWMTHW